MGRSIIKFLFLLTPALGVFGPLIMIFGFDPLNHAWADTGALMTGCGSMILFLKIMNQSKEIDDLTRKIREGTHHGE